MSRKINILFFELRHKVGGIEVFLYNLFQKIDKERFQFHFITSVAEPAFEKEIKESGGIIYHIPSSNHFFQYMDGIKRILKTEKFDIIHINKNSACNIIPFYLAKKYGCQAILAHAHNTSPSTGRLTRLLHHMNKKYLLHCMDRGVACSTVAAQWLYGKRYCTENQVTILKNGVDTTKFSFEPMQRSIVRKKLNLDDKLVIGHVGRFMKQKNHKFLIEVFYELLKKEKNAVLMLIGDGELKDKCIQQSRTLGIEENILFLGKRTDISDLMLAMDIFAMPSLYEGLPVAGVEAQTSGLPLIVSDSVSKELKIADAVTYVSLDESKNKWADKILENVGTVDRTNAFIKMREAGYDMTNTSEILSKMYLKMAKGVNTSE